MAKVVKTYAQPVPSMRLIGRRYLPGDKQNGTYAHLWNMWFEQGLFGPLEKLHAAMPAYEDGGAYVGFMNCDGTDLAMEDYWIGMLLPEGTLVPDGYEHLDIDANTMHVAWVQGREENGEVYCTEDMCLAALNANGLPTAYRQGLNRIMERYVCPRFTAPDQHGLIILDMCFLNC